VRRLGRGVVVMVTVVAVWLKGAVQQGETIARAGVMGHVSTRRAPTAVRVGLF
jgi:hypothetical protein